MRVNLSNRIDNFMLLAGIIMKPSIIAVMLVASTTLSSLAQELSAEDRACITSAVAKLPQVAALNIEGSRAIEGRVLEQPQSQGRRKWNVYRVRVEIDVSEATQCRRSVRFDPAPFCASMLNQKREDCSSTTLSAPKALRAC
jgi:hypothetical protein